MNSPRWLRLPSTLMAATACLLAASPAGGCKKLVKVETTYLEHFVLEGRDVAPAQDKDALDTLHRWLSARGYTQLTKPADIAAAMPWDRGSSDDEVWRRPLDPAVPKSKFIVTIAGSRPELLLINLTADREGEDADHKRQIPLIESERADFYKAFEALHWLKQEDYR